MSRVSVQLPSFGTHGGVQDPRAKVVVTFDTVSVTVLVAVIPSMIEVIGNDV